MQKFSPIELTLRSVCVCVCMPTTNEKRDKGALASLSIRAFPAQYTIHAEQSGDSGDIRLRLGMG